MLTSLLFLLQVKVKKNQKIDKILKMEEVKFISFERNVAYDDIKSE